MGRIKGQWTRWLALLGLALAPWATAVSQPLPALAADNATTYAIDANGVLRSWGNDWWGQLGLGRKLFQTQPQAVASGFGTAPWPAAQPTLAMDNLHGAAVRADGALLTWGRNDFGQLGNGGRLDTTLPTVVGQGFVAVACGETFTLALDRQGQLFRLSGGAFSPIPGGPWIGLAARGSLAMALKANGELWAWGQLWSAQGTLDYGSQPVLIGTHFRELALDYGHVLALKQDGSLWGWGGNDSRQLGIDGSFRATPTPIAAGPFVAIHTSGLDSAALDAQGAVWAWGTWSRTPVVVAQGFSAIARKGPLVALRPDASAWVLEHGLPARQVAVPGRYALLGDSSGNTSMAIGVDGTLYTWGGDEAGQLGIGSAVNQTLPRTVGPGWRQISVFGLRPLGVRADGSIWAFGDRRSTPEPSSAFVGSGFVSVTGGGGHALALKADGSLWAAGRNERGQLGDGTSLERQTAVLIGSGFSAVAAGSQHSLGLKNDGSLWAWGANGHGQLGDGSTTDRPAPIKVGEGFAALYAKGDRSFALDARNVGWAWGHNDQGQLGIGSTLDSPRPSRIEGRFRALAPGPFHTLGLGEDGQLWAWGSNSWRAFGAADVAHSSRPVAVGTPGWTALAVGDFHSVGMKSDGSVWSWGWNRSGELGTGTLLELIESPRPVLNEAGTDYFDQTPATPIDPTHRLLPYFAVAQRRGIDLAATLTDLRAAGLSGEVYFSALLPKDSPLLGTCSGAACPPAADVRKRSAGTRRPQADAAASSGMVAGVLTRGGFKQTSGQAAATGSPAYNGSLATGAALSVYQDMQRDPMAQSKAVICMGVTVPELSAKGQVLMLPIATGTDVQGLVQCPPVQTAVNVARFRAEASGPITARTIVTDITPLPEERGQQRKIFSWAVAPNGRHYMQTGPGQWVPMAETMLHAATVTLPLSGSYRFETTKALDLSGLVGTLVFVGVGESWADVRNLNKAAQHHTVQ